MLGWRDACGPVFEQCVGDFDDVCGRPVVSGEVEHNRVWPRANNFIQQLWVGTIESINRLVGVTHAEQIGICTGHFLKHHELKRVHVLGFVYKNCFRAVTK